MSMDFAFWVWNLVANMAYGTRYRDIHPVMLRRLHALQNELIAQSEKIEQAAGTLWLTDPEAAIAMISEFQVRVGQETLVQWRDFWMELAMRFRDGMVIGPPKKPLCKPGQRDGCTMKEFPDVNFSPAPDEWYGRIVSENGVHYEAPHPPPGDTSVAHLGAMR